MADIFDQVGDIVEAKERKELEARYEEAVNEANWGLAHDLLLEWTNNVIDVYRQNREETSSELKALLAKQSEVIAKQSEVIKRLGG